MNNLKFSYNWNKKLFCNCFTTFRIYNRNKYQIGHIFNILLRVKKVYKKICEAELINIIVFKLDEIPEYFARIDTGYSKEDFITLVEKMYLKSDIDVHQSRFMFLLFKKIDIQNHKIQIPNPK